MNLQETFGSLVFNDAVMRQRLPKETYRALHRTIAEGKSLPMVFWRDGTYYETELFRPAISKDE